MGLQIFIFILISLCSVCLVFANILPKSDRLLIDPLSDLDLSGETQWRTKDGNWPKLAGHRGEKVFLPENTLISYEFAALFNVDFIEPDLVLTKDGKLVCSHDLSLKRTTNIAQLEEFSDRMKNFTISIPGGENYTFVDDWLIEDFDLIELQKVKVLQQAKGIRPLYFNDMFYVPSFQEYLDKVYEMSVKMNKTFGLIPELKAPKFHNRRNPGTPYWMENIFLEELEQNGYPIKTMSQGKGPKEVECQWKNITCLPLTIQCFEKESLQYFKSQNIPQEGLVEQMYLVDTEFPEDLTPRGIKEASEYANIFAINKAFVYWGVATALEALGIELSNETLALIEERGGFVEGHLFPTEAHQNGMRLGIYTIYDSREESFPGYSGIKTNEMNTYFYYGVDEIFVENIPEARELRNKYDYILKTNAKRQTSGASTTSPGIIFALFFILSFQYIF